MGPPSSFFLAIVAIVILFFAILSFISAVNYKNVSNNDTEGDSISKGTANSLSTTMIIFGIIMILVFIWFGYLIFTYDRKDNPLIDKRDTSLLVKAKESINKLQSVKESYNKLTERFNEFRKKASEKDKEKSSWDYCPDPLIKLSIKDKTGKIQEVKYDKNGEPTELIIKPESVGEGCNKTFRKLEFNMETQPCYTIDQDCEMGKGGSGLLGKKWGNMMGGGMMTQSMNVNAPIGFGSSNFIPGMKNVINPSFQVTDMNNMMKQGCEQKEGFLTKKSVPLPGVNFGSCEKPQVPMGNRNAPPMLPFASTTGFYQPTSGM
jgi:hypothetical protein